MHSTIFQITTQRISKDCFLNENTLPQGDNSEFDYCREISEDERKTAINNLIETILPKGMFTLLNNDTIIYKGGAAEWYAKWVNRIQEKANKITPENITDWIGASYQLEEELKNPLGVGTRFYTEEHSFASYADQSGDFMRIICGFKDGTKLYIGGIIDYHY